MDIKDLLLKLVGKAYNKSADEVSSLLFEKDGEDKEVLKKDALDQLFDLDKARAEKLTGDTKAHYDKGYKKAQAETLAKFEKDVKEKYGISEDKQGLELIDALIASKVSTSDLDEEKVKRSKTYLDAIDGLKKETAAVKKEWEDKFNAREKQLQKDATFKSISDKALTFVKSLNPVLPTDPKRAEAQLQTLVDKLRGYDYEVKEDGKIVVLKKEGDDWKVLTDDHKHPISFEAMVKQHAESYWDFKQGQPRKGTGNNNDDAGSGQKGYSGPIPKSEAEYQDALKNAPDEDTKIEITKAWVGQVK